MSAQQLKASEIDNGDIRISVGLENIDDLIEDIKNAL
jgi:cystathionine beta-lyase/cystathionine gamma-synthase